MARPSIFGLLVVCLSLNLSLCQNCERRFLVEPGQLANSPLNCNTVIGGIVVLKCKIELIDQMQYQIGWYHSKYEARAGEKGTRLENDVAGYRIVHVTGNGTVMSTLKIVPFEADLHSGFYWCEIFNLTFPTSGVINPSQVVSITVPSSSDQLEQCVRFYFNLFVTTMRCALGPIGNVDIVVGVEFTNFITTTPTLPSSDVTTEKSSSANMIRMALIWFSVGSVTFILIMLAFILCSVAIAKC